MADLQTRVERYENGVLVETTFVDKPLEQFNTETLHERAVAALAANQAFLATPNASITQADALAQIKAQARQINGLIRLLLQRIDEIED